MGDLPRVSAFGPTVKGRGSNDSDNGARESAIEILFSQDIVCRNQLLKDSSDRKKWGLIRSAFAKSIEKFVATGGPGIPPSIGEFSHVARLGGRGNNYDFDGFFETESGSTLKLKIEIKRGQSIYDQPEFLQIYAKDGFMVKSTFPSYASWFYDNHLSSVSGLATKPTPTKIEYLKKCFGTDYGVFPFTDKLYKLDEKGSVTNKKLQAIAWQSIDEYLGELERDTSKLDLKTVQERLNEQKGKIFVSWDPDSKSFNVEMFSADAMNLNSKITFKKRPSGQRSSVLLENKAGNQIQCLLRWKNHNCLLGPGWQISLKDV